MSKYTTKAVILTTLIFSIISLYHFYWAMGGTFGYEEVLPTNTMGTKRLDPSMNAGLIVALGMLLIAFVTVGTQGMFDNI